MYRICRTQITVEKKDVIFFTDDLVHVVFLSIPMECQMGSELFFQQIFETMQKKQQQLHICKKKIFFVCKF